METSAVQPDVGRTRIIESQQGISWLPKLPREVLFMIAEHLERPSQIPLALTCKSLFTSLCPGRLFPKLDEKDLPDLLLQLEKENPNWFLCFGCTRLRPLRRDNEGNLQGQLHPHCDSTLRLVRWSHSLRLPKIRRSGCRGAVDGFAWIETLSLVTWRPAVLGPGGHVPEITFSEGHLVMNRHFYGPRFGLPTRHLESVFEFERRIPLDGGGGGGGELGTGHFPLGAHPPRGGRYHLRPPRRNGSSPPTRWVFAHRTSAKVLDDELYLRRSHTVSGPPCSASDFSRVVDGLELPVCRHILGSSRMPSSRFWEEGDNCLPELQNLRIAAAEPALDLHPDDGVGSCVLCFTDYEVAIQRGGGRTDWNLRLTTFHKLGSFRSLRDEAWGRLRSSSHAGLGPEYYRQSPAGGVRRKWLQGREAGSSTPPGERSTSENGTRAGLAPYWVLSFQSMIQERYYRFDRGDREARAVYARIFLRCIVGQGSLEKQHSVLYHGDKMSGEALD